MKDAVLVGLGGASGSAAYQILVHGFGQTEWHRAILVGAFTMVFYQLFDAIRRRFLQHNQK
ncbi:hypothetical protein MN202_05845 [Rheinheimera muenzenbergensis]|uniref:Uncharacterized protein n=1 Tax=Rheinheimera muenzenbergensis TaxID=1193628 RepID=A0ABU8C493_9GAMM